MNGKAILKKALRHDVEIELDGVQIAALFWELDDSEQAQFFNSIGMVDRLPFQLQFVTDCGVLNQAGRAAMERIGEYGPAQ